MPVVKIDFINETTELIDRRQLNETIRKEVKMLPSGSRYLVVVRCVKDKLMRRLNHKFMKRNDTTDVLSFPVQQFKRGTLRVTFPKDVPVLLGEVVVNIDQAHRQAKLAGHNLVTEVKLLIGHGVKHLIGFHHN